MAYATYNDVEARWRPLTDDERARASVLLDDASATLTQLVDVRPEDSVQADLLRATCANMVIRAMSASGFDSFGASQMTVTAGPYSQTYNYANPSGDMYLTKFEKRQLGITTSYIGSIRPMMAGDHD